MGRFTMTYADYDAEVSSVSYPGSDLIEANITQEFADALALQTATEAVVRGLLLRTEHVAKTSPQAVGKSDDEEAQREEKALVRYYDDTTFKRATLEIPCVDMTLQHPNRPGYFYQAGTSGHETAWGDFVTAFEAFVPGPSGNAAVIEEIIHIGRRL